jgi:hypothetical protein
MMSILYTELYFATKIHYVYNVEESQVQLKVILLTFVPS